MTTTLLRNIKALTLTLLTHLILLLALFLANRLFFTAINSVKAIDVDTTLLLQALLHGTIFDTSIWAYLALLTAATVALLYPLLPLQPILRTLNHIIASIGAIFAFLLPAEAITYGIWSHHVDAASLLTIANRPSLILASTETSFEITYTIICLTLATTYFILTNKLTKLALKLAKLPTPETKTKTTTTLTSLTALTIAALLIIPIRGGLGLAPLNTGRAYFSHSTFANHIAVNPIWNFLYSIKRAKQANTQYNFLPDPLMQTTFQQLYTTQDSFPKILNTTQPNIVIILLESFSAHGIAYLGGQNATPNIDSLRHTGIYFNNIYASSDRSGKGLLAVLNAYPSLPTTQIIQFPQKTQNIPSLATQLRKHGYKNQTFIYAGDINFNNFNSLVNQNNFNQVITQDDFPTSQLGDKWGAHDQYAFERLLQTIDQQQQPFYNLIFTLSSHEPYTVPIPQQLNDPYLNSMYYTDQCLGQFFQAARQKTWWKNTLFILIADHGHPGPDKVQITDKRRFNIPLIITGGPLTVADSLVTTYGSQTDITTTLLKQLNIPSSDFTFSKNLLDPTTPNFAFFDFNDGFGFATPDNYQIYDNQLNDYTRNDNPDADTISGKAYLQKIAKDFQQR